MMLWSLVSGGTANRWLIVSCVLFVALSVPRFSYADSTPPPDLRSCVCNGISDAPRDLFTARQVIIDHTWRLEVVEVLTHGVEMRQVPGELVVGGTAFLGNGCESGSCLAYETRHDTFCLLPISSLDLDLATRRTLSCNVQAGDFYDRICTAEFSLSQLKPFMDALAAKEGTCQALATKYLGIPKPSEEQPDNFLHCGGGTPPGWLVSILAALGFLAFRAWRQHIIAMSKR